MSTKKFQDKYKFVVKKEMIFFLLITVIMVIMVTFGINSSMWTYENNSAQFLRSIVVEVVEDNVTYNQTGIPTGDQLLIVELKSGSRQGEVVEVQNRLFPIDQAIRASIGDRLIIFFQEGVDGSYFAHVHGFDRVISVNIVIIGFLGLLILIFGKSGLRAAFGLMFAFVSIIFLLLPLVIYGVPPGLITTCLSLLITSVSIISIMGFEKKTLISILGSFIGIGCYIVFYFLIGAFLQINGTNINQVDILINAGLHLSARQLLFSSILIASLGGIMDMSVTLASAISEIRSANEQIKFPDLYRSGMKVGRDIIGSSASTLILAFTGTFLVSLVVFATTNTTSHVLISRNDVGIEVLRAVSASVAMIICAPITVLLGSSLFLKREEKI